ncbi:protein of unknown function (plasmid) [Caballeronia sp. S22]
MCGFAAGNVRQARQNRGITLIFFKVNTVIINPSSSRLTQMRRQFIGCRASPARRSFVILLEIGIVYFVRLT